MPSSSPFIGLIGLGYEPTLDELLGELTPSALSILLKSPMRSAKAARQHLAALGNKERKEFLDITHRLVSGSRIDKEDLEEIAKSHSINFSRSTPCDVIVLELIEKLGLTRVDSIIERALKPGAIEFSGTFGAYSAPKIDVGKLDPNTFGTTLEKQLQTQLSNDKKEERKVKVRIEHLKDQLLVVVYYERPNKDGREITARKQLRLASFKRGAGSTYFRLSPDKAGTLLTLRTPTQKLANRIRTALGSALWGNPDAIPNTAARTYNLDIFKRADFLMPTIPVPGFDIESVRLQQIEVLAATGNLLRVTATAPTQDALSDFRRLAREAKAFTKEVRVRIVDMRISYTTEGNKVRVARALLKPDAIHMSEEHFLLVDSHLQAWGVTDVTSG